MVTERSVDVCVIGGGVVGIATALRLAESGASVAVVERDLPGAGASSGNAGQIRPSECLPLAGPGVIGETLRHALRRHPPVRVLPRVPARWLMRFARSSLRLMEHV